MTDTSLKKQISNLRNTLFDKNRDNLSEANLDKKDNTSSKLVPANINNKSLTKSSGIFHDIKSMDGRLERLEETFYNYAYDSTKVLTSFKKIEKQLPHTCPLVPKEGKTIIKRKKEFFKTIIYYFGLLALITLAVFLSNIIYEVIYYKLNSN